MSAIDVLVAKLPDALLVLLVAYRLAKYLATISSNMFR